ncbi:MAG: PocR ligand-binding domain-containing protein [Desulfobacteraceae bacterium]|jgi:ligand-binding sensor protein
MELLDLCSLEKWESLENEIRKRTGLNASVYNIEGYRIFPAEHWPNRLCPEIKAVPKGQSFICAAAHMNIALLAKSSKSPVIEECDAGLIKLVVPIFVKEEFVGAVSGCGMLLDDGEVDTFLVHKMTELDEALLEELSADLPAISMEQAHEISRFIQGQLEQIVADYQKSVSGEGP